LKYTGAFSASGDDNALYKPITYLLTYFVKHVTLLSAGTHSAVSQTNCNRSYTLNC